MWRNKNRSKWTNSSRRMPWDKKDKDKSSIVCYEYKKPRHFKSKCPYLVKSQNKKKFFKTKAKKEIMNTWEDLDYTSSNEDDEDANICLMAYTTSEGSKSD
ncbi:hypothetical protein GmHk_09G025315 [Glycine max]|nr:hypothetical protein GmHk_09G025315 [Glycine max]